MRVQPHMYAVAAGALLMTLIGTAAMGAEQPQLKSNHTEGSEAVANLGESQTSFMSMQGISATPMSDEDLSKISGQRMNLNFLYPTNLGPRTYYINDYGSASETYVSRIFHRR